LNELHTIAPHRSHLALVQTDEITDPSGKAGRVAVEMERRLMLGEYQFGETLSIAQLTRQFDTSRQPVAAAIGHLRSSGYVEVIPRVGCRVVSPSLTEIGDFFVALGKLEAAAAGFAARRYENDQADTLAEIADRGNAMWLESQTERLDYITSLYDYHRQIWAMAKSPLLEGRVASMRRLATFYLWQGQAKLLPTSARLLSVERSEIAQSIRARDTYRAEILMEKHVAHKPFVNGIMTKTP
jgi:DNA-binding GntR family transcriptional regulator|tara:strand:+ start:5153 stop:5875 length:723 start_codon:yes stop_codon:yes gene_type:complete